jgi:hypothetical protein
MKNEPANIGKVSSIFRDRKAEVLSVHMQVADANREAHVIFYVEMAGTTAGVEQMIDALTSERFIREARADSKNRAFFESNMFPPTSGGHYRVFIMGAQSWINLVRSFKQKFGTPADTILYSQGVSAGIEMAQGIEERIGAEEREAEPRLSNLRGLFRATGLGLLEISGHRENFSLMISETMGARTGLVDNFLVGLAAGALGRLFSKEYSVSELKHTKGGVLTFRLT